jgi:hypothetical protein
MMSSIESPDIRREQALVGRAEATERPVVGIGANACAHPATKAAAAATVVTVCIVEIGHGDQRNHFWKSATILCSGAGKEI